MYWGIHIDNIKIVQIQNDIGCDVIKIQPEEAYGNYAASCLRVTKERKKVEAPGFVNEIPNLEPYDVILLGYPVWAQNLPQFVAEFIRKCNVKNKTVIPFVTFGMSGVSWTMKTLKKVCAEAEIKYPFDYGLIKKDRYDVWIKSVKELL